MPGFPRCVSRRRHSAEPAPQHRFAALGPDFFTELRPTPLPSPHWVGTSPAVAQLLGLDEAALHSDEALQAFTGNRLLATASRLDKTALGRRVLAENGLEGETMARFIAAGRKYPTPYVALPAWTRHGKAAGALLTEIRIEDDGMRVVLSDESRLRGGEDAQFAGLQASHNGQTLIADDAQTALRLAQENPESGVVIRLHGEERLLNAARLTGGRITEPDEVARTVRSVAEAESAYRKAFGMLPGRMYPLYRLMKFYEAEGQMRKAEEMARQIIAFRPKVDSPAVREMKNEAKKLTKR